MSNNLIDQPAHFGAACVALLPAALWPNPLSFAWAGFCLGMIREITEEGAPVTVSKVVHAVHSWRDLLFWTLGGLFAGVFV